MRKADNLPPSCAVFTKSGKLNFVESFGPVRACNGTALPFYPWTRRPGAHCSRSGLSSRPTREYVCERTSNQQALPEFLPITPGTEVTLQNIPTCCLLQVGCVCSEPVSSVTDTEYYGSVLSVFHFVTVQES